ncbi:type VI secretion system baseplate subunit TssK [Oryzomicrobium sp.]|uniref:type VI secretion system baseplate subunit TssK n=1 Tax=Oryzomicrobium sp. TaxID=1911578 RepID=UPI002FE2544A
MSATFRVLWGEGMFLRPQHFQQQARFVDAQLAKTARLTHIHPWGLRRLDIDRDALAGGFLRVVHLEALFQDGTDFSAPLDDPLPPQRNLNDLPQLSSSTVVHACLPAYDAFGGNCIQDAGQASKPVRFTLGNRTAADLFTTALEADITALQANVRLMLEEENRDGFLSLPIARIGKNASGSWSVDEDYIPPLLALSASTALVAQLRRLLDILEVKSQALAATHRERAKDVVEYGTTDIASFWLLHTVNRSFPLLKHFLQYPEVHPEALYALLAQLTGELLTFSSSLTLAEIPVYRHLEGTQVFRKLDELIRTLLDTVISNRYMVIPLTNTKPSFYVGHLDSDRLLEKTDFYLSISSEASIPNLVETVPMKLKIGAPDDVERVLNSALGGIRLTHATQTPAAIPVRVGNHYFALEPHGTIFERMMKSRAICIYVPQGLLDMKLELIAVFR